MELILSSLAGTLSLFVVQSAEFVHREYARELASTIRAIPQLLKDLDTPTATVSVAGAGRR
jgi:hypothetical protein